VVRHAAERQPYIDQGQSVNLYFPPRADKGYLHRVHMQAWREGLKAVYYARTESSVSVDAVGQKLERQKLMDTTEVPPEPAVQPGASESTDSSCVACEG
jgi:ribonucleoside-diphosphate reductase alpha chain